MNKSRFTKTQIVSILKEVDVGFKVSEQHEIACIQRDYMHP
jgi:hypothetical protein